MFSSAALRQLLPQNPSLQQLLPEYRQPGKFLGHDLQNFKHGGTGDNSEVASTSGVGTSIYSEGRFYCSHEISIVLIGYEKINQTIQ